MGERGPSYFELGFHAEWEARFEHLHTNCYGFREQPIVRLHGPVRLVHLDGARGYGANGNTSFLLYWTIVCTHGFFFFLPFTRRVFFFFHSARDSMRLCLVLATSRVFRTNWPGLRRVRSMWRDVIYISTCGFFFANLACFHLQTQGSRGGTAISRNEAGDMSACLVPRARVRSF